MFAHRFGPTVELESLEQHERPRLGNALKYSENPADMHQRRVDDRNTATQLPWRRWPVAFRTHDTVRQHVVGEVYAFGRPGCSAGQHSHGDARPHLVVSSSLADRNHFRLGGKV